ncbi:MAG: polysaccharide biosynthesis C-terminal domain-containing protein [Flavobacteriales bacterium]|nr:polysaccharide biosynthesis C-terminal domain-containing protein [Flavobacteriales bacterium]MCB9166089.1 polysaccharide biosynthesis C-terminal domain-containing protein [Flavobacteriales bacterium]
MGIVLRQSAWNSALSYVGVALGFVNMVVLFPHVLSADEFGLTRVLVSITVMVAQVAQLGMESALLRFFPYFRDPAQAHRGALGLALKVATIGIVLGGSFLLLFRGNMVQWFSDRSGILAGAYDALFPLLISEVYFIVLRAYARSLRESVAPVFVREVLLRILQLVLILAYALGTFTFDAFIWLYVGTFVVVALALFVHLLRMGHWLPGFERPLPRRSVRRSLVSYSAYTIAAGMAVMVMGNLDQLMLGVMLKDGLKYVAYYAVAYYIGSVISIPARAVGQIAFPLLADAWRRRDMTTIDRLYKRSASGQFVVGALTYLLVISGLGAFLQLLPPEYAMGRHVILIVGAAQLFNMSLGLNGGIINMSRHFRFDALTGILLLCVNATANFLLIKSQGFMGAAWATLGSLVVVNLVRLGFLKRRFGLWPFDRRMGIGLTAMAVTLVVLWFLPGLPGPWYDLFLRGTVVLVVFVPLVLVFRVSPDVNAMVRRPFGRSSWPVDDPPRST